MAEMADNGEGKLDFSDAAMRYLRATFPTADEPSMNASMLLLHLANRLQQDSEKRAHRPHGLGWSGYSALFSLAVYGEAHAGYLARVAGISRQAMSRVISALERDKLIKRVGGEDRRTQTIQLTDLGREFSTRATAEQIAVSEEWFGDLSFKERQEFLRLIERVITSRAARRQQIKE